METILVYKHVRNLFVKNKFKPFVNKYFRDVEFLGCECGYWYPEIKVSNWNEIKDFLPKSYLPFQIIDKK